MTQVTLRSNKKYFSTWNALNHFDICSDSFKLRTNMYLSLGPKKYGKKVRRAKQFSYPSMIQSWQKMQWSFSEA